jgi:ribonuclease VapC
MIIDASAIVAIIKQEPEAAQFSRAIEAATPCRMSTASFVEAAIVIDSQGDPTVSRRYDEALRDANVELAPVDETQARIAREAYRDFGKGSGHPARLNFGDCFAYALAKASGEPLLFKGDDFSHTDVTPALAR